MEIKYFTKTKSPNMSLIFVKYVITSKVSLTQNHSYAYNIKLNQMGKNTRTWARDIASLTPWRNSWICKHKHHTIPLLKIHHTHQENIKTQSFTHITQNKEHPDQKQSWKLEIQQHPPEPWQVHQ